MRLRRDLYVLVNTKYSLFSLANALYQPSVISLETALNYLGADRPGAPDNFSDWTWHI